MKLITKTFYSLICLFLCFFGGNSNNINNKRTLNNSIKKVNSSSKALPELEILESKYDSDYVEFSLKYNIKISSLNFVEDNLKCNLIKYDGPFLYCEIIMVDDLAQIDLDIYTADDNLNKISIGFYKSKELNKIFTSNKSKEYAWYLSMEECEERKILSEDDICENYQSLFTGKLVEDITDLSNQNTRSTADTYYEAYIYWEDNNHCTHPLRNTKVIMYDDTGLGFGTYMDSGLTDENGYICFDFVNYDKWYTLEKDGADPFLRICAQGNIYSIRRDWVLEYITQYSVCTTVTKNVKTGSKISSSLLIPYNTKDHCLQSFSISQALSYGESFAEKTCGAISNICDDEKLNVEYPLYADQSSAFTYKLYNGGGYSCIGEWNFNDWQCILHEFGHYIEGYMNIYGSTLLDIITFDSTHFEDTDHFVDKNNKKFAMELTWMESWSNVFAIMVFDFFGNDISGVSYTKSIKNYKSEYKYFDFINDNSCEAIENTVSTFLYMLYDSFGLEKYWNLSTIKETYTLSKFVENLDKYVDYRFTTTYYLSRTHIAPSDIKKVNQCNRQTPPEFSWVPNGSSTYPNNQFQIVFYDKNNKELYRTDYIKDLEIKSNNATVSYQLTNEEWKDALSLIQNYDTILVGVIAYQTDVKNSRLISGPYRSSMIEFYLYNL